MPDTMTATTGHDGHVPPAPASSTPGPVTGTDGHGDHVQRAPGSSTPGPVTAPTDTVTTYSVHPHIDTVPGDRPTRHRDHVQRAPGLRRYRGRGGTDLAYPVA